jgi:hypothetical protein
MRTPCSLEFIRRRASFVELDGLVAPANGSSKIRSLLCKRPAVKENPSNLLANGMNLSSRQFDHPEVKAFSSEVGAGSR